MKVAVTQTSFNGGEFSPLLMGHLDAPFRNNAVKTCINLLPLKQGPLTRRSGSKFVLPVKNSDSKTALIKFEFNVKQNYIIELGHKYMRFFYNDGIILQAHNPIISYDLNSNIITLTNQDLKTDDLVYLYNEERNLSKYCKSQQIAANKIKLLDFYNSTVINLNALNLTLADKIAKIYEIETPYAQEDLFDEHGILLISVCQSADILYLTHQNYKPQQLKRLGHTNWVLEDFVAIDGPYLDINTTDISLQPSALTGLISVFASRDLFSLNDQGRFLRILQNNHYGYGVINEVKNAKEILLQVKANFLNMSASTDWQIGSWCVQNGYPSLVYIYQNRLVFAKQKSAPQRLDFSASLDLYNFAPSDYNGVVADDHAISVNLNSDNINPINWLLYHEKGLLVGTLGAEWLIASNNNIKPITPLNIQAIKLTNLGSNLVPALSAGGSALFVQRSRQKLQYITFMIDEDGFRNLDLTLFAEHITSPGIIALAWQQEPSGIIWVLREDGALLGVTYDQGQKVTSWHRHILGGFSNNEATKMAEVEAIMVINNNAENYQELWLIVKRMINNKIYRYVEYIIPNLTQYNNSKEEIFVDSYLNYKSTKKVNKVTGIEHLERQEVSIVVDGAMHPSLKVLNGAVELQTSANEVIVGLKNKWFLETLPLDSLNLNNQNNLLSPKRINHIIIKLLNSSGIRYGARIDNLKEIIMPLYFYNVKADLYTGDTDKLPFNGGSQNNPSVILEHDGPYPVTILSLTAQFNLEEKL